MNKKEMHLKEIEKALNKGGIKCRVVKAEDILLPEEGVVEMPDDEELEQLKRELWAEIEGGK